MKRRDFVKLTGLGCGAAMAMTMLPKAAAWAADIPGAKGPVFMNEQFGLGREEITRALAAALSKGGDFSEVFFEYKVSTSINIEEDIVKNSSESITLGAGVRVIAGEQVGYAYTSELTEEKLTKAALTAAAIAAGSAKNMKINLTPRAPKSQVYGFGDPFHEKRIAEKIAITRAAYDAAKNYDSKITKVSASLGDDIQYVTIANSEGLYVADTRPQVRLSVSATAEKDGKRNTGNGNNGGRAGADFYKTVETPESIGKRAAEEALLLLTAVDAPAGELPVVLSRHQSGVMIHEAVGHPLEADFAWRKTSIMWDKMNKTVAAPGVTIYDDASIANYRGSLNVDDEGTEPTNAMLIENGTLVGFLHDRLSAKILGAKPNGHARRESFRNPPIPRMNNTVLAGGDRDPDEIIQSVKKGIYAVTYQGGQVSGAGKFTFSVNMGYLIEDGKLTTPIKNATLIGTNVATLMDIDMIGNDTGFFLGTCGKEGQSVPVTCGTPTIRISKMTVGGVA